MEIPGEALVPGDLLVLSEGDFIHADAEVVSASNLATDESQLTGESDPQTKKPVGTDQDQVDGSSHVFAGSRVIAGHGFVSVTTTGASTEYGRIAGLVAEAKSDRTPLERKVAGSVRWTAAVGMALSVAVFLLEISRGTAPGRAFLYSITLAMASVGEEFVLVLTVFLSVGAFRLAREGVLVRRINCVETLGSTTVICLDKTGTLTAGSYDLDTIRPFTDEMTQATLLRNAVLACEVPARDPMEIAITRACTKSGVDIEQIHRDWQLLFDYDFDPRGKHMSHVWKSTDGDAGVIVAKGALEGILEHCKIDPQSRQRVIRDNTELAGAGMRVLAVAGRASGSPGDFTDRRSEDERDLQLYGLLGFHDPVRSGVPSAIAECQRAGVRLKLVTGRSSTDGSRDSGRHRTLPSQ